MAQKHSESTRNIRKSSINLFIRLLVEILQFHPQFDADKESHSRIFDFVFDSFECQFDGLTTVFAVANDGADPIAVVKPNAVLTARSAAVIRWG